MPYSPEKNFIWAEDLLKHWQGVVVLRLPGGHWHLCGRGSCVQRCMTCTLPGHFMQLYHRCSKHAHLIGHQLRAATVPMRKLAAMTKACLIGATFCYKRARQDWLQFIRLCGTFPWWANFRYMHLSACKLWSISLHDQRCKCAHDRNIVAVAKYNRAYRWVHEHYLWVSCCI